MRRRQFEQQLHVLLRAPVEGWSDADKGAAVSRHVDALLADNELDRFAVRFEPFVPGRRPDDEAAYPGLGSSEQVGLFNPKRPLSDHVKLLVRCYSDGRLVSDVASRAAVKATIEAIDDAGLTLGTVAGWSQRDVTTRLVAVGGHGEEPEVAGIPAPFELDLDVNEVFGSPDPALVDSHLGFGSLFHQRFRVLLDVEVGGARVAGDELVVDIYNESGFGSLYQRLIDVLLTYDTQVRRVTPVPPVTCRSRTIPGSLCCASACRSPGSTWRRSPPIL